MDKVEQITYCQSGKCRKADKCGRWWINNFADFNPKTVFKFMDPYKKGKKCKYFVT